MGGYNLDYGPELVSEAMSKDIIAIALPIYKGTSDFYARNGTI